MNPPFSLSCAQRKVAAPGGKRKALFVQIPPLAGLDEDGGRARRCPRKLRVFCRVRLRLGEQRWCFLAFGGLGNGFRGGRRMGSAISPARSASLRAAWEIIGSGSGKKSRSNQFCSSIHGNGASRATCLQVTAKLEPRPTQEFASTAEVSCQDPSSQPKLDPKAGQV